MVREMPWLRTVEHDERRSEGDCSGQREFFCRKTQLTSSGADRRNQHRRGSTLPYRLDRIGPCARRGNCQRLADFDQRRTGDRQIDHPPSNLRVFGQTLRILYVSGEESSRQIKLRAARLGVNSENLYILTETDVQNVVEQIRSDQPDLVMIDSIQTMNFTDLNSSPEASHRCASARMP